MKANWLVLAIFIPMIALGASQVAKVRHVSGETSTYDTLKIWWQNLAGATSYHVQLRDVNGNRLSTSSVNTNTITLANLNSNTSYYVKIRGYAGKKTGRWSVAKLFTTPVKPSQITTTIFGGDVMLSRYVGRAVTQSGDFTKPFANIGPEFKQNDLAFINLEAPFKESGPYTVADSAMSFKVDPRFIDGLTYAGIDLVSMENNHISNAGSSGIDFTKQHLTNHNINYCFEEPKLVTVKDMTFGFLCYSYDRTLDTGVLRTDIDTIREQADVIIVSMHNGNEYTDVISSAQSNFAHAAIDYGADVVIGHHPHVVQRMEKYNDHYIFYSLGNLIFDQNWSWLTQLGAVVKLTWQDDQLQKIEFKPIKIDYNYQPRFMNTDEGKQVLDRLQVADYEIIL